MTELAVTTCLELAGQVCVCVCVSTVFQHLNECMQFLAEKLEMYNKRKFPKNTLKKSMVVMCMNVALNHRRM